MLHKAYPDEAVTADVDAASAEGGEQVLLALRTQHLLIAGAQNLECPVGLGKLLLRRDQVMDVGAGAKPLVHTALLVQLLLAPDEPPTVLTICATEPALERASLA